MRGTSIWIAALSVGLGGPACRDPDPTPGPSEATEIDRESTVPSAAPSTGENPEPAEPATEQPPAVAPRAAAPAPAPAQPQAEPAEPPEHRRANQTLRVFAEPSFDAAFRGVVPSRETFAVYERVEGDTACRHEGWGRLGASGYACLQRTQPSSGRPRTLPPVRDGRLAPFVYFQRDKREPPDAEAPGIWRSLGGLRRGDDPIREVQPHRNYAYARRRGGRGGPFLIDENRNTVREKDVTYLKPSRFAGRDLIRDPIPEEVQLAWSTHWPGSLIYPEARLDAKPSGRVDFHETFYVTGDRHRSHGTTFLRVANRGQGEEEPEAEAWVEAKRVQRYAPFEAPPEVNADQRWLDIDLEQQTLAIMSGQRAEFVTVVSTGSWKDPTPTGLFRLISKHAHDDMRSRPSEDDKYTVEGVPWVVYFKGRYALHGTYWHNRFGMRTSHGCVNLSLADARRVFESTTPEVPPGWHTAYEHQDDLGTLLRIRKGAEHPEDRRADVRQRRRADYR